MTRKKYIKPTCLVSLDNKVIDMRLNYLSVLEHNLLFSIFKFIRDEEEFTFDKKTILDMMIAQNRKIGIEEFGNIIKRLADNFLGLNIYIEGSENRYLNIFSFMELQFEDKEKTIINGVKIVLNKDALFLFRNLTSKFTIINLECYKAFDSVYTKLIYLHLSKNSSLGIWKVDYNNFKEILNIPNSYEFKHINSRILKISCNELKEIFIGLKYEIVKERINGKLEHKWIIFKFQKFQYTSNPTFSLIEMSKNNKRTLFGIKILNEELDKRINNQLDRGISPTKMIEAQGEINKIKYEILR